MMGKVIIIMLLVPLGIYLLSACHDKENEEQKTTQKSDETGPVLYQVPKSVEFNLGDNIDIEQWVKKTQITAEDDTDGEVKINIEDDDLKIDSPGSYVLKLSAQDSAGNITTQTVNVIIKENPVYMAYRTAVDMTIDQLDKQGNGYTFKGIPIPKDESDHIEDGTIYRAIALQLEYFYDNESTYDTWGEDLLSLIFAEGKDSNYESMENKVMRVGTFLNAEGERKPFGELFNRFSKMDCVEGKFDFKKAEVDFKINDLSKTASNLGITEEMLGYILAAINEWSPDASFNGNTYSCKLKYIGERGVTKKDRIFYFKHRNDVDVTNNMEEGDSYYFWRLKSELAEKSDDQKDMDDSSVDCCTTYKGISMLSSKNSVRFIYGLGIEGEIDEDDVTQTYKEDSKEMDAVAFHSVKSYIAYTIKETNDQLVFYFDGDGDLVVMGLIYKDTYY